VNEGSAEETSNGKEETRENEEVSSEERSCGVENCEEGSSVDMKDAEDTQEEAKTEEELLPTANEW
jgi:hypothetical protein